MQEKKTKARSTEVFYLKTSRMLRNQVARQLSCSPERIHPVELVQFLIDRKGRYSKKTWQTYKAAVINELKLSLSPPEDMPPLALTEYQAICVAISELGNISQGGAIPRARRTSAKKAKEVADDDLSKIAEYLQAETKSQVMRPGPRNRLSEALLVWCRASLMTGLRPSEWLNAELVELADGSLVLRVRNAKHSNGRANGLHRHLKLDKLSNEELNVIERQLELIDEHRNEIAFQTLKSSLQRLLNRVARRVLSRRAKYPSLYTFRHQFSANAKSAMGGKAEVAALMGHASDASAGRSYARATSGCGGVRVSPSPAEVANVRVALSSLPSSRPKPGL